MYRIDGKFIPRNNRLVEGFASTSGPTMTITSDNVTSASTSNNLIALTFTASEGVIDFDKNCIKVIGPDSNIISDTDSLISNFMIQEHEVTFKPYDTACYSTGECTGTLTNYLKPMVFTANLDLTSAVKGNYIISVYDGTEPSSSGTIPRFKSYSGNLNEVNTDDKNLSFTYDNIDPLITLNGPSIVDHILGNNYIDQGATATDNIDGDISSSIITSGLEEVNINQVGSYDIIYSVSDSTGNSATQVTRTVNVIDNIDPLITLNGPSTVGHILGSNYIDQGATATDNADGDISSSIITSGLEEVNINQVGSYDINYNVSDSTGNSATQVTRTVNVQELTVDGPLTITLNPVPIEDYSKTRNYSNPSDNNNIFYHLKGETYSDPSVKVETESGIDITGNVTIEQTIKKIETTAVTVDAIDINTQGRYEITYNVKNSNGDIIDESEPRMVYIVPYLK